MKPVRTFIQQNGIRFCLGAEKILYDLSKGRLAQNRFLSALDVPYIGSKVKIIKETETSTFIAKYNDNGTIDNGDFKLLATTDMHTDEDYSLNNKTLQLFINQIRDEKPDLVILTGDCIQSKYQQFEAIHFAQMMEKLGVYWAYVFGNHEAREEKEFHKYLIFKSLSDYPHCLSKFGDPSLFGYGNFIVNIMNSETELKQSLVFMDSGRDIIPEYMARDGVPAEMENGYDYIKPDQINWYEKEMTALKEQYGICPNLLYMHIPIKEYEEIFQLNENGEYVPTGKGEVLYGRMFESVGCSPFNSGLFEAMKRNGAQGIFCGHDHVNDWAAIYEGILLVYNQMGSYNAYSLGDFRGTSRPEEEWQQGVTLTTIHNDTTIDLKQSFNSRYLKK